MLRPLHPSSSAQTSVSKIARSLPEDGSQRRGVSSNSESATGDGLEWEPLPNSAKADKSHKCASSSEKALPDSEPSKIISQSTGTRSHPQKMPREARTSPLARQEGQQDSPPIPPAEESSCAEETHHASDKRIDLEEEELQALLPKLLDAFDDVHTPSGKGRLWWCCLLGCVFVVCLRISECSPGWPGTAWVDQTVLEFTEVYLARP